MASHVTVKVNKKAFGEIARSGGVASRCASAAEAICAQANSLLDPDDGYHYDGFEVKDMKDAPGKVVRTKTDHARASQAKNNTLMKSVDAGRG